MKKDLAIVIFTGILIAIICTIIILFSRMFYLNVSNSAKLQGAEMAINTIINMAVEKGGVVFSGKNPDGKTQQIKLILVQPQSETLEKEQSKK